MYISILMFSFCLESYTSNPILVWPVQDPNWYKARWKDGLEGMVPANFLQEAMYHAKVYLHRIEWVFSQAGDRAWRTEKGAFHFKHFRMDLLVFILEMQIKSQHRHCPHLIIKVCPLNLWENVPECFTVRIVGLLKKMLDACYITKCSSNLHNIRC